MYNHKKIPGFTQIPINPKKVRLLLDLNFKVQCIDPNDKTRKICLFQYKLNGQKTYREFQASFDIDSMLRRGFSLLCARLLLSYFKVTFNIGKIHTYKK